MFSSSLPPVATQKAKKMNNTNSTKKPEVNAGAHEGYTLMVGMIH
jgi:hypothetical protein